VWIDITSQASLRQTWWNKAVETQAQDRIHRLGQTRACRVIRFVAAESIESRMVELQEAKAAIGKGAFESLNVEEKRKARMADLKKVLEL
jgi:SNF2 family DNA or RNA helicase